MKKITCIIINVILSLYCTGQIKSFTAATSLDKPTKVSYDSTTNFVGENAELLIGQALFVIPKPEELQRFGYHNFYDKYEDTNNHLASIKTYEAFAGKIFWVEEVLPHTGKSDYYKTKLVLKLKSQTNDTTYYYLYDWHTNKLFPFIIMGFYVKEKINCVGKQIVLKNKNPWESVSNEQKVPIHDVLTGLPIPIDPEVVWNVKELLIDQKHGELAYMITNRQDKTFTIALNAINDYHRRGGPCALLYDEQLKEIHEHQPDFYKLIMEARICINMTRDMVLMACGAPEEIRNTSSGELWIYSSGKYLTFKNGILKSFY